MWLEGIQKKRVEIEVDGPALMKAVESAVYTKFPRLRDHRVDCEGFLEFLRPHGNGYSGDIASRGESSAARVLQELSEIIGDVK